MKYIITFGIIVFMSPFLISCGKDSLSADEAGATILKKWNILNDSNFIGVGINNHPVSYAGQRDDYYDFRNDGYLYIKEGPILDTLSYNLTSNTTIVIASFGIIINGVPEVCNITNLTAHHVTIKTPLEITPGGVFGRTVNLTR